MEQGEENKAGWRGCPTCGQLPRESAATGCETIAKTIGILVAGLMIGAVAAVISIF